MKNCPNCSRDLSPESFSKNARRKDGRQSYCKECMKEINAQHYKKGYKDRQKECNRKNRDKIRRYVERVKIANPCPCGELDPCCLDFHHLADKQGGIANMMADTLKLDTVMREVAKCCIVCSNCHRKMHAGSKLMWTLDKLVPLEAERYLE